MFLDVFGCIFKDFKLFKILGSLKKLMVKTFAWLFVSKRFMDNPGDTVDAKSESRNATRKDELNEAAPKP